jgi:hypothetical protein
MRDDIIAMAWEAGDKKLLDLLDDYLLAVSLVVDAHRSAIWRFHYKDDSVAWRYLFLWRELSDMRDEAWARLGRAVSLTRGQA